MQDLRCTVRLADHHLPVPLINIARVQIIEIFVSSDRVHIRIKAFSRFKSVSFECRPLPFREGLDDLIGLSGHCFDIELDRPLNTVQVIIQTGGLIDEQRSRYALQVHLAPELLLERIADELDRILRIPYRHVRIIILRQYKTHGSSLLI